MNRDEVIPPSPPEKLNEINGRSKQVNSMRSSKPKRPILSLRSKLHGKSKETEANGLSGVSVVQEISPIEKSFDIYAYASVDDEPNEEKEHIGTQLNEFDILAQPKLIEQKLMNLAQKYQPMQKNCETHQFSATQNLCSLATLLATRNHSEILPVAGPLNAIAKEISQENLQFSQWPTNSNDTICANEQAQTDCDGHENSSASSIVHSILLDFCNDDDNDDSAPIQEETAQTPSFILIRRAQRKTYERTSIAQFKTLIFDDGIGEYGGHYNQSQIDKNKSVCETDNEHTIQDLSLTMQAGAAATTATTSVTTEAEATNGEFTDIDSVHGHFDQMIGEPQLKRSRIDQNVTFEQNESNNIAMERPNHMKFDCSRLASCRNEESAEKAMAKARNIFGKDLSDLGFDDSIVGFKPCAIAEPINFAEMGFKTAAGSNIAVKVTNMQRYTKILDNIPELDVNNNRKALKCRKPIEAKENRDARIDFEDWFESGDDSLNELFSDF